MIRFRAFGAADLRDNDGNELRTVLARPGQLALLAYLAIARPRGFHRRDTVIGLFWPETAQDQARNALRQAVHRLRHELGADAIESRGAEELSVNAAVLWSDVAAFDDAVAAGKTSDALEHYRGDLLPGFFLAEAPGFEQWLESERARLRQRAASAAWELSRAEVAKGQLPMASHWARRAYALNPDDEADLRKLIDVLVRTGDHAAAVRAYDEFSERVSREYEIEPSKATRALVDPLRVARDATAPQPAAVRTTRGTFPPYTPYTELPLPAADVESAESAPPAPIPAQRVIPRLRIAAIASAALIAIALALGTWRYTHRTPEPPAEAIAVFPFSIRGSSDLTYLREGMVDLLSAKIEGADGLRSIDPRAILSASRANDSLANAQPQAVAVISRKLGAGAFVVGDVVQLAGRVTISGALYEVGNVLRPVTKMSVEGDLPELPRLVDQLAGRLIAARAKGRDSTITKLAALTTHSLPALTSFLEGESQFRAGHAEAAREAFRTAIREDSTFALAYIRLATTHGWSSASTIDPIALLAAARRHSSRLSPLARQLLEGYDAYYHADAQLAVETFTNVTRNYPDRVEAWFMLGESRSHLSLFLGHAPAEARAAFERVLVLDPDNPHALVHLARIAATEGRYDDLKTVVAHYLATRPDGDRVREMRALRAFALRDSGETAAVLNDARRAESIDLYTMYMAATSYTENVPAAHTLAKFIAERGTTVEPAFGVMISLTPTADLMRGRFVHGLSVTGVPALDRGWSAVMRSLFVADVPVPLPPVAMQALRDTVAGWDPSADDMRYFSYVRPILPQIRFYLRGIMEVRLGDEKGLNSSLAGLAATMRAARDSGVSRDLLHLVRAERERSVGNLASALREIEQFEFSSRHYGTMSFRPAYAQARFARAEILHAFGRDEEAERWYGSLSEQYDAMYIPLVHLRQAQIAQRRGNGADAANQYRRFIALWTDCDPELRPVVNQAAAALRNLAR